MNPQCPECESNLEKVVYNPDCSLNFEQWSSIRAGDYYCTNCKGDRGKTDYRYYWEREVKEFSSNMNT